MKPPWLGLAFCPGLDTTCMLSWILENVQWSALIVDALDSNLPQLQSSHTSCFIPLRLHSLFVSFTSSISANQRSCSPIKKKKKSLDTHWLHISTHLVWSRKKLLFHYIKSTCLDLVENTAKTSKKVEVLPNVVACIRDLLLIRQNVCHNASWSSRFRTFGKYQCMPHQINTGDTKEDSCNTPQLHEETELQWRN